MAKTVDSTLRLVAWEITRRCNLSCQHCRACAEDHFYEGELSHAQGITLLDQIREVGQPIIILTGGEPMLREDVYDLAEYGNRIGLRMVTASGVVFRADVATGSEGVSPSIFIGYPWEL